MTFSSYEKFTVVPLKWSERAFLLQFLLVFPLKHAAKIRGVMNFILPNIERHFTNALPKANFRQRMNAANAENMHPTMFIHCEN